MNIINNKKKSGSSKSVGSSILNIIKKFIKWYGKLYDGKTLKSRAAILGFSVLIVSVVLMEIGIAIKPSENPEEPNEANRSIPEIVTEANTEAITETTTNPVTKAEIVSETIEPTQEPTLKPTHEPVVITYWLNTKSGIYHYASCGTIKSGTTESYWMSTEDIEWLRSSEEYRPCGRCHP